MSKTVCLYLHVHQPLRLRDYSVFDTAQNHDYFSGNEDNDRNNRQVFLKVTEKSYRPMNALLEKILLKNPDFKVSLSITGTFIDQALEWTPDLIDSFQRLIRTGRVEVLSETYHHSLAFFYSRSEFDHQVKMHRDKVRELFGVETTAFRNTELAYNDELALWADSRGFDAIIAEGWDGVLEWRSPNYLYQPAGVNKTKLLLKNYKLSDDIAFRFGNKAWAEWPLSAEKYSHWLSESLNQGGELINLFMDYETFGEHQWEDTGIFDFFGEFVDEWSQTGGSFTTITEAAQNFAAKGTISMPNTVTWADTERDLTAWLGNSMQQEAIHHIYALENDILKCQDPILIEDWRRLQTSDHFYYMCTKWFNDGDVHAYFSPYESPYDAFLYFMNAVRDLRYRVMQSQREVF